MDILELSRRTRIGARLLRYVIEYRVLPPIVGVNPGRGQAREFNEYAGFCIALAAYLMEMGLRRRLVEQVMHMALKYRKAGASKESPPIFVLTYVFGFAKRSTLEIGDGRNLRIVSESDHVLAKGRNLRLLNIPWTRMDKQEELKDGYEPLGCLAVRLDVLAGRVRSG